MSRVNQHSGGYWNNGTSPTGNAGMTTIGVVFVALVVVVGTVVVASSFEVFLHSCCRLVVLELLLLLSLTLTGTITSSILITMMMMINWIDRIDNSKATGG